MNMIQILDDLVEPMIRFLPATQQRLFACRTARRTFERDHAEGYSPPLACWAAIEIAELFAVGRATEAELNGASWDAAKDLSYWFPDGIMNPTTVEAALETSYWATDCATEHIYGGWEAISKKAPKPREILAQELALQLADLLGVLAR